MNLQNVTMNMPVDQSLPWDTISEIRRSDRKSEIIEHLDDDPASATVLADEMGIQRETVSNYLRDLKKREPGLVYCLTPKQPHHRLYDLTEVGETVREHL